MRISDYYDCVLACFLLYNYRHTINVELFLIFCDPEVKIYLGIKCNRMKRNKWIGRMLMIVTSLMMVTFFSFGQSKSIPSVTVGKLEGGNVDVSSYAKNGKITVFMFWATWCSPCIKELKNVSDVYEDWQDEYGVEIVAVSIDDARSSARVKAMVNGNGWEYEVLLDKNQDLKRAMNFQAAPYTVLVDKKGNVVYTHSGYVEGDEEILEEEIAKLAK